MELATFTCQTFIFYMVAVLSSDFLSDKDRLVAYAESTIGSIAIQELFIVVPVSFLVIGILHTLSDKYSSRWAKRLIETVLQDIPRTIYLFGSSATGVLLAISTFGYKDADPSTITGSMVILSVVAAATFFLYGCFVSYILK